MRVESSSTVGRGHAVNVYFAPPRSAAAFAPLCWLHPKR